MMTTSWKNFLNLLPIPSPSSLQDYEKGLTFPLQGFRVSGEFRFTAEEGQVSLGAESGIYAVRGRAFFREVGREKVEQALEDAKVLKLLLDSMENEDLDVALGKLAEVKNDEWQIEGEYFLARRGDLFALRRGLIFGKPDMDWAFLTSEKEVTFSFPGEVGVTFEPKWFSGWVSLANLRFRWGEDEFCFEFTRNSSSQDVLTKDPITPSLREIVTEELLYIPRIEEPPSPKIRAFLRAFAEHEDPLGALVNGRFMPYAKAEVFFDL
jgi:hypothetical protein